MAGELIGTPVTIRPIQLGDADAVARLSGQLGYEITAGQARQRLSRILESPEDEGFTAVGSEGAIVGWVHVFRALRLGSDPFAEVGGLVVDEACRGRGLGGRLMERAERWALDHGLATLRVRTNQVRQDTQRFYERIGYARSKAQVVFARRLD